MNKKLNTRIFITLGLVVLLVGAMVVAGCTDTTKKTGEVPPLQKQSIKVSGSTTVLPVAQKAAEAYMATHPNADIQISGGGSGVGIQQIGEKTVDIGMSSRDLKATENAKYPDLVKHIVAKDGIAIVVHPKNEIKGIQAATVADIYTGKITLWTQVPGAHLPGTNTQIVVIGRDSASGTREFFDTHPNGILKGTPPTKSMLEKNSNGAVAQTITQTPGAIGYVSIGFVTGDVKAVPVWYNDSSTAVAPTRDNVLSGAYPINRDLFMFTNGQPSGLAADFIGFIRSPDGQKIVEEEGCVRIS
jgi:phosphate transport system substrate-binding protein